MNSGIISFIRTNFPVFLFITPLGWTTEKKIFSNYYWFSKDTNSKWHCFEKKVNEKFNINIFFFFYKHTKIKQRLYLYMYRFWYKRAQKKNSTSFWFSLLGIWFHIWRWLTFLIKNLVQKSVKVNGVKEITLENT